MMEKAVVQKPIFDENTFKPGNAFDMYVRSDLPNLSYDATKKIVGKHINILVLETEDRGETLIVLSVDKQKNPGESRRREVKISIDDYMKDRVEFTRLKPEEVKKGEN